MLKNEKRVQRCTGDFLEIKDLCWFVAGIIAGFLVGVAIYWLPLGQFVNELKALKNLISNKYQRGTEIKISAGAELKTLAGKVATTGMNDNVEMKVFHDEGVNWFHTGSQGWIRARVLQIYSSKDDSVIYRVCHLDVKG